MTERVSYQRGRVRVVRRRWLVSKKGARQPVTVRRYRVEIWAQTLEWAPIVERDNFLPARAIAMALSRIIGGNRYQTKVEGKA